MSRKTKRLNEPKVETLQWVPIKGGKRAYELRGGDQIFGRIRWPKMFGSLAEAEFGDDRWTFKRGGFLKPRVTVRPAGSEEDSAVLELSWGGGGLLKTKTGRCFRWSRQGFWTQHFVFADEKGAELLRIEPKFGMLRRSGAIQVHAQAADLEELPLLLLFGWYVTMLIADDDASSAACVVACCS